MSSLANTSFCIIQGFSKMARIISEEISTSFDDNIFSCKISSDISFGYHLKRDISRDFVSNETEISQCRLRRDLLISSQLKTLNFLINISFRCLRYLIRLSRRSYYRLENISLEMIPSLERDLSLEMIPRLKRERSLEMILIWLIHSRDDIVSDERFNMTLDKRDLQQRG